MKSGERFHFRQVHEVKGGSACAFPDFLYSTAMIVFQGKNGIDLSSLTLA